MIVIVSRLLFVSERRVYVSAMTEELLVLTVTRSSPLFPNLAA